LTGDDGQPLRIHRQRIRTTRYAMRDRQGWTGSGRATIDPNHSPQLEGDRYLTAATPVQQQAVDTIIEDAQHDMLRKAHPPTVVTDAQAAALARDFPQLVAGLKLDDSVIAELAGGQRDVFVAACADQLSGLHGPKGKPCPARPWVARRVPERSKTLIPAFTTQPGDTRRRGLQRQSIERSHEAKASRRRRATCAPPFSSPGSAQRASKSII
jgi:hypothetical protein